MLTDVAIRNAKGGEKARKLYDGKGLFLIVTPAGGKWWRYRYSFAGREKLLSFGTYPEISVKQARERRDEARRMLADGRDPSVERQAAKAAADVAARREDGAFEAVAAEWFEKFRPRWVGEHAETIAARLNRDVLPWLGAKHVGDITAPDILTVLRRIEARGAISTAHRVKQIIGQVIRYAVATGRAERDPSADLRGALAPERERHFGALTRPADVAALMRAIDGYQGSFIVRQAMKFSALTFARPGEIRKAEWAEIDLDGAIWRIPAARMKMRREHLIPLSRQAVDILCELRPLTGAERYVFPGRAASKPLSENAITAALRYLGYERGAMTAHGFRSTASTILNELGWPADVIERQLAHAERDEIRGAYNRAEYLDGRIEMMQAWADYLDKLTAGARVIPLKNNSDSMEHVA